MIDTGLRHGEVQDAWQLQPKQNKHHAVKHELEHFPNIIGA